MITIIDYKSGNLRSISNSFKKIGSKAIITDDPAEIANAKHLVLPGVGAFGTAMENIEPYKDVIFEHIDDGKPFLGICLGLQVLLSSSEESPGVKGLDIFKGHVAKIPEGRKIPHMGWNQIRQTKNCPILDGVDGKDFYFVHSYHAVLDDTENLSATADYGFDVTAAVSKDNVFATQFHPEKSGEPGLKILKNFVSLE
ncbi:imidazole glycerol phosphate synthase subunit HisH [uncultured Methanobrevibacter sp.]|uniref:imidazole glycerol phosphate synthase subunit HisH n=1 Tax=uncultured Methanobrevibacter sp. TaxID=253161 RepID=UPI0025D0B02A|nr:imidazole glycerol phosphate synthase subunit HisH [uncultured Methanobrevibacter sp.]